jgi:hypothetical protein
MLMLGWARGLTVVGAVASFVLAASAPALGAQRAGCSSGAHTLGAPGTVLYPELGNGGYTSVHTDVFTVYDAPTNTFLPGNHVDLTEQSTQCLTDFSLDFERTNAVTGGPNMTVTSVTVNGQPASVQFVAPTYPGDPNGQDDPDPLAHRTGLANPVGASNPNPPACTPTGASAGLQNQPCPANKLVITPATPIPDATTFHVTINYTGTPGVHGDADGTTEGWFRNNSPAGDGGFVTTEPAGTEDWMPLNDVPSAKPTYDFFDTVNLGKTAIANGQLISHADNAPDANFPSGSTSWHWQSTDPIASYLVENSVGSYDLSQRVAPSGLVFYEAQASSIAAPQKATNKAFMDQQEDITSFQSTFNGPYPFGSAGVVVGIPSASFEEEMQTMITFAGSSVDLQTLNHENMHQWWGDNVSEASFEMTFFKEGFARLGEDLATARTAATVAGGIGTPAGDAAFESSLKDQFATSYNTGLSTFWTQAPSHPPADNLFSPSATYTRPALALIALRAILGPARFNAALAATQSDYGGAAITEPQLEAEFRAGVPTPGAACDTALHDFFTQWWDTAYPSGGGSNRPQLTGPGLAAYDGHQPCAAQPLTTAAVSPSAVSGYRRTASVTLSASETGGPGIASTSYSLDGDPAQAYSGPIAVTGDGPHSLTYFSTDNGGTIEATQTLPAFQLDATAPTTTGAVSPAPSGGVVTGPSATVTLNAADGAGSGVAATHYTVDGGSSTPYTTPFVVTGDGPHVVAFHSTDVAGNDEPPQQLTFTIATPPPTTNTTPPPPPPKKHTPPKLTGLRISHGKIRFTLSEAATVTVAEEQMLRHGRHHTVRTLKHRLTKGTHSLSLGKLAKGHYRLVVRATDSAGRSSTHTVSLHKT